MTTESRAPLAADWADVVEALHGALTIITVRGQYPAGHPAIRRADEQAATGFARVFKRISEVVVALIDNEFIVSERPRPELRERLPGLADVMVRHEIECFVFQQGITTAECSAFAEILSAPPDAAEPARARDQAQARLTHVLLRFAELRSQDGRRGTGGAAEYVVPAVHEALADLTRAIVRGATIDQREIHRVAESILSRCAVRAFALEPRAYAVGENDLATHAANVATMTAAMAHETAFPEAIRKELTAAALVHDIGRLLLPAAIRGVPEPLLDERGRKEFRYHPFLGARALLAGGCPALWVAVALEHHRGVDGGGYPSFGSNAAPHELVRLVSLANYFDDKRARLDRTVDSPPEVLRAARALESRYFDRATLELFSRALGAFPPGTFVELSDRQAAMATRSNPGDPLRPEVLILLGQNTGKRVDLKALNAAERKHEVSIVRAIAPPLVKRGDAPEERVGSTTSATAALTDLSAISGGEPMASMPPQAARVSSLPPLRQPTARPAPPPVDASRNVPGAGRLSSGPSRTVSAPTGPAVAEPPSAPGRPVLDLASALAGSLQRVPKVVLAAGAITKLPLDPRAGFLLSFIDGASSLEAIIDGSGLGQEEVLRMIGDLLRHGAIALT